MSALWGRPAAARTAGGSTAAGVHYAYRYSGLALARPVFPPPNPSPNSWSKHPIPPIWKQLSITRSPPGSIWAGDNSPPCPSLSPSSQRLSLEMVERFAKLAAQEAEAARKAVRAVRHKALERAK